MPFVFPITCILPVIKGAKFPKHISSMSYSFLHINFHIQIFFVSFKIEKLFQFEKIYSIFHNVHKKNAAAEDIVLLFLCSVVRVNVEGNWRKLSQVADKFLFKTGNILYIL